MAQRIADGVYNAYFMTPTVVDWVDAFTRNVYRQIFVDALNYAVDNKGLELYAWVLMSNHAHLVASALQGYNLSDIMRDMLKHTSKKIVAEVQAFPESRAEWMLYRFAYAGKYDPKIKNYRFWQEGTYPKEYHNTAFLKQKIHYTHYNPVRAGIVAEPEHYLYSSAIDYAGGKGLVRVTVLEL